jgi:hypothetical protein
MIHLLMRYSASEYHLCQLFAINAEREMIAFRKY